MLIAPRKVHAFENLIDVLFDSQIKFPAEKTEEVLSDIYHFRVADARDVVKFQTKIPLYADIGMKEQAMVKYVDGRTENIERIFKKDEVPCFDYN